MENSNKETTRNVFTEIEEIRLDPKNQIRAIYNRFVSEFKQTYNDPETIGKQIIIHLDELDPKDAQTTAKHLIKQYGYYNASTQGVTTFIFNQKGVDIEEWERAKGALNAILKDWINKQQVNTDANTDTTPLIDLSDTRGTDKIRYLYELGIIDYLRDTEPFSTSTNSLATVISAFTGIDPTTAQSYINPIINDDTIQNNNPLNNINKMDKVKNKLIEIGFKPFK